MKLLKGFYDDNEAGGSSRWLVSPSTVEVWLSGQIERAEQRGERRARIDESDKCEEHLKKAVNVELEHWLNQITNEHDEAIRQAERESILALRPEKEEHLQILRTASSVARQVPDRYADGWNAALIEWVSRIRERNKTP